MHRRDVHNAIYNPRKINPDARSKLQDNLERVGLLEPLVWNKRTGNLVSGHQRISILDALEGSDNYKLDVSIVDLSLTEEKAQNIFFNNYTAQGEFDVEMLGELFAEQGVNHESSGFTAGEMQFLFADTSWEAQLSPSYSLEMASEATQESAEEIADIKQARKEHKVAGRARDTTDFVVNIVFGDEARVAEFIEALGLTAGTRIVDGAMLTRRLGAKP